MAVADCLYHSESWSWVLSHLFWLCADCCSVHYFGIFFICCLASLEATVSGNLSVRNFNMTLSAVQLPPVISARWFDDVACLLLAIHSFSSQTHPRGWFILPRILDTELQLVPQQDVTSHFPLVVSHPPVWWCYILLDFSISLPQGSLLDVLSVWFEDILLFLHWFYLRLTICLQYS